MKVEVKTGIGIRNTKVLTKRMILIKGSVQKVVTLAALRPTNIKSPAEIRIEVLIQRKDEAAKIEN